MHCKAEQPLFASTHKYIHYGMVTFILYKKIDDYFTYFVSNEDQFVFVSARLVKKCI